MGDAGKLQKLGWEFKIIQEIWCKLSKQYKTWQNFTKLDETYKL